MAVLHKYLIIHMDDIGMGYAANKAAQDLFKNGMATSASVMVPCSWSFDFIRWCRENPGFDVGVHLTHTCEWDVCRWGALTDRKEAPSLYDPDGFLWRGFGEEMLSVSPGEYMHECEAQVEMALHWGLQPTHLDNHMWTAAKSPELFRCYLNIARKTGIIPNIPPFILYNDTMTGLFHESGFHTVIQPVGSGRNDQGYEGKKADLRRILEQLQPGIHVMTLHPVIETEEIKVIIPDWEERHMEYRLFTDREIGRWIKELDIKLTTWREVAGSACS